MKALKIVLTAVGILVVFLGLVFIIGQRPVVGAVILAVGIFLTITGLRRPSEKKIVVNRHELELTGDVRLEDLKCRHCGASLSSDSISLRAGTVFVSCPYCQSEYQIEEAPKW